MRNIKTNQHCSKCASDNAVFIILSKLYCSICALKEVQTDE